MIDVQLLAGLDVVAVVRALLLLPVAHALRKVHKSLRFMLGRDMVNDDRDQWRRFSSDVMSWGFAYSLNMK
jgi:hypothetical protein